MPLTFHRHLIPEGELGLWKIEENELFFLEQMHLFPEEEELLKRIKGHRTLEWLASRWLLHIMSGRADRGACLKDEFGKPYLVNSFYDISISHSREYVSVMGAPEEVGVDIQKLVSKIESIAHKFLREEEKESLSTASFLEHLHVYWGAKEALYKAYGRKRLDFREHIHIHPFQFDLDNGRCSGFVRKENYYETFEIGYEQIDDYILVHARKQVEDQRIA